MKVVETDNVIREMLDEEYRRCQEIIKALSAKVENYLKGALNVRKKQIKGKEYAYHYLVHRDGKNIINRHIANKVLPEVRKQIEEREKLWSEIRVYEKRMAYLERILRKQKHKDRHANSIAR